MSARVIAGTVTAYVTTYSGVGPSELKQLREQDLLDKLNFSSHDMTTTGWTKVGIANVRVELIDTTEILNNTVAALRIKQQKALADAQLVSTRIEQQIQSLLAIGYEPA